MSIINDALKKTQTSLNNNNSQNSHQNQVSSRKISSWMKFTMLIIISGFIGCAIVFSNILISSKTIHSKDEKEGNLINLNALKEIVQIKPTKKQKSQKSELIVNGIMQSGDHYTALINNKIVNPGDTINNKKILNIEEDHVKLFDNGQVVILELNP